MKTSVAVKSKVIDELNGKLEKSSAVYVVDYLGMTVEEVNDLRAKFRAEKIFYKVVKNTLVKRALKSRNVEGIDAFLAGPTAVAVTLGDEITPAKIILDFSKKQKKNLPRLKAAVIDGKVFNDKQVEAMSKLPTKREYYGILAGTLNAPIVKLAGTLQALVVQIAYAVNAVKEKKEQEGAQ